RESKYAGRTRRRCVSPRRRTPARPRCAVEAGDGALRATASELTVGAAAHRLPGHPGRALSKVNLRFRRVAGARTARIHRKAALRRESDATARVLRAIGGTRLFRQPKRKIPGCVQRTSYCIQIILGACSRRACGVIYSAVTYT